MRELSNDEATTVRDLTILRSFLWCVRSSRSSSTVEAPYDSNTSTSSIPPSRRYTCPVSLTPALSFHTTRHWPYTSHFNFLHWPALVFPDRSVNHP
jgi:hypothetical protein